LTGKDDRRFAPDGRLSQATDIALGLASAVFGVSLLGRGTASFGLLATFYLAVTGAGVLGAWAHRTEIAHGRSGWAWWSTMACIQICVITITSGLLLFLGPADVRVIAAGTLGLDGIVPLALYFGAFQGATRWRDEALDVRSWNFVLMQATTVILGLAIAAAVDLGSPSPALAGYVLLAAFVAVLAFGVQNYLGRYGGIWVIDNNSIFHILLGASLCVLYVGLTRVRV
jgi:hypothetical protein